MHEIICPHCGKAFKIDEAGYADILKQVRDSDFEKQLHERLELAEQDKRNAVELAQAKVTSELQKAASAKDAEIKELKAKLNAGEVERKLAVSEVLSGVEKDRAVLTGALEKLQQEKEAAFQLAEAKLHRKEFLFNIGRAGAITSSTRSIRRSASSPRSDRARLMDRPRSMEPIRGSERRS